MYEIHVQPGRSEFKDRRRDGSRPSYIDIIVIAACKHGARGVGWFTPFHFRRGMRGSNVAVT